MSDDAIREFMRVSQIANMPPSQQSQGVPLPPLELEYPAEAQLIPLTEESELNIPATDLRAAINRRVSVRRYAEGALTLDELSWLLWATQGVRAVSDRPVTFRTVPSAGSRHAFETYLLVNRVDELKPGVYRYVALEHALLPVFPGEEMAEKITAACLGQKQVFTSAVTFIWVAIPQRMVWRYGERGYRYMFLDAGHVCQNLYLAAEPLNCGVCAIAAYDDNALNEALQLDGENAFAIYAASLGRRVKE